MKPHPILPLPVPSAFGMLWSGPSDVYAGNPDHGKGIYGRLYWRCHGRSDKSDGPISETMNPRQWDLTDRT